MEAERRGGGGREERRDVGESTGVDRQEVVEIEGRRCSGGTNGGRRGGEGMTGWCREKTVVDMERSGVRGKEEGSEKARDEGREGREKRGGLRENEGGEGGGQWWVWWRESGVAQGRRGSGGRQAGRQVGREAEGVAEGEERRKGDGGRGAVPACLPTMLHTSQNKLRWKLFVGCFSPFPSRHREIHCFTETAHSIQFTHSQGNIHDSNSAHFKHLPICSPLPEGQCKQQLFQSHPSSKNMEEMGWRTPYICFITALKQTSICIFPPFRKPTNLISNT